MDQWKIRSDPGHVRTLVFARDHGVCASCGLDCEAKARELGIRKPLAPWYSNEARAYRETMEAQGIPGHRTSLWDADHIVPVVEGGGECDLDNYRTLCLWCHQIVTAELRARLATAKSRANYAAKVAKFKLPEARR